MAGPLSTPLSTANFITNLKGAGSTRPFSKIPIPGGAKGFDGSPPDPFALLRTQAHLFHEKVRRSPLARTKKEVSLIQKPIRRMAPIFILPTFAAFLIGFVWPFIQGIYLSFCNFNTPKDAQWTGLANYIKVFSDTGFLNAFKNTALFALVSIVLINVLAFTIAYALTSGCGVSICSAPYSSCPT